MTTQHHKIQHCKGPRNARLFLVGLDPQKDPSVKGDRDPGQFWLVRYLDACPECGDSAMEVAVVTLSGNIREFKPVRAKERPSWEPRMLAGEEIITARDLRALLKNTAQVVGEYTQLISGDTADVYERVLRTA